MVYLNYRLNDWYNRYIDRGQSGLRIFYFNNRDFAGDLEKTEIVKDISYSSSADKGFHRNYFSLRAIGIFTPPKSGHYKFFLRSDDASRLYIEGDIIIDNAETSGIHASVEIYKTVFLRKRPHLVVIEYFQAWGEAELDFSWLGTGETERDNSLDIYFYPAVADLQWDVEIKQLYKIYELKNSAYLFLLWTIGVIFIIWFNFVYGFIIIGSIDKFLRKQEILRAAILLVIVLVVNFYPIVFKGRTLVSDPGSNYVQDGGGPYWQIEPYYFLHHYFYFNIKAIPLWNPYEGTGFPLSAVFNCGSFSPFSLLFSIYPCHLTMDLIMLIRLFCAGFFMYLFLRRMKLNFLAVFIGSCFFMLATPNIACINQFQMDTVVLVPAVLCFLDKALASGRKKYWILSAVFIALSILGGNPEECLLSISIISLFFIIRLLFTPLESTSLTGFSNSLPKGRSFRNCLIILVTGLCLAAFFILPAIEFYKQSHIAGRDFSGGEGLNLATIAHLFFVPRIPQIPPNTRYISIVVVFLMFVVISNFRNLDKIGKGYMIFSLIYMAGFLAMLFWNPLTVWLKNLSILRHIWWGKYISTFYIALAVVAAMGLDALMQRKYNFNRITLLLMWTAVAIFFVYVVNFSIIKKEFKENPVVFYYLLVILSLFLVIRKREIKYISLICTLFLIEMFIFIPRTYPGRNNKVTSTDATVYLQDLSKKDVFRVQGIGIGHITEPNRNCIYQLQSFIQSGILKLKRYDNFLEFTKFSQRPDTSFRRFIDFLNIKYICYNRDWPVNEPDFKLVYNQGNEFIYENKRAYPRAFIVHRAEKISDEKMVLERFMDKEFDLRHNVIVEKDLPSERLQCRGAPVVDNSYARIINYTPNKVLIRAVLENDGFLVLSDTYYPGWKAYVDGKRTDIYLTDYFVRSVYLEKGEHIVEFRYLPFTFFAGLVITFISILYLFIWRP